MGNTLFPNVTLRSDSYTDHNNTTSNTTFNTTSSFSTSSNNVQNRGSDRGSDRGSGYLSPISEVNSSKSRVSDGGDTNMINRLV